MKYEPLDSNVRPQDDFFGYVNNNWLRTNPIPPSESSWGTFYQLRDESWAAVHDIISSLKKIQPSLLTHDQNLLRKYFKTALEFTNYSSSHIILIKKEIETIKSIENSEQLANYIGRCHRHNLSPFWTWYVDLDDKDSSHQVMRLHQSGLRLPNRDYYLDNSSHMIDIRDKYAKHKKRVSNLLPELESIFNWDQSIEIEKLIAQASWADVKLRDVHENYTKFSNVSLGKRYFNFNWKSYFDGLGWNEPNDSLVIGQPTYFDKIIKLLHQIPLDNIKSYLSWYTVSHFLSWIDEESAAESFSFYGSTISGTTEIKPLWKRVVLQADNLIIGETLGREYAAKHFPADSKKAVIKIVEEIRAAYHRRINKLTWMSDKTKVRAHTKLDNIKVFIGYPTTWQSLEGLILSDSNHIANILTARAFETDIELKKIGQKPAKEEWHMSAHTVNAYHHPNRLEIVFPAAILQPPFYDPKSSHSTNLGGIGAVIGHEFTHGFDDQGAEFDEQGNVNTWQNAKERSAFKTRSNTIVSQADKFEVIPGVRLKGGLILGEAIADLGGLELAIEALILNPDNDGTTEQLEELFINFARCESGAATKERSIELAKIDPHPPSVFRVNNIINSTDEFYNIYNVKPGDNLYLPTQQRTKIW